MNVLTTVQLNTNSLTLAGGTLQGAAVTASGGAELVAESGYLNGVTVNGTLDLSQGTGYFGASVTVYNGLVLEWDASAFR